MDNSLEANGGQNIGMGQYRDNETASKLHIHVKWASQHKTRQDSRAATARRMVNVGSCDARETLWTASCWFALAPLERDEAMMLSQLTFRESESLTKAGTASKETA